MIDLRFVIAQKKISLCDICGLLCIVNQDSVPRLIFRWSCYRHLLIPLIGQVELLISTIDHSSIRKSAMFNYLASVKSNIGRHDLLLRLVGIFLYQF